MQIFIRTTKILVFGQIPWNSTQKGSSQLTKMLMLARGHHFELLPFGSGRRVCPGVSLGLQMVQLTLASFLHSFEILNPSTEPIDMTGTLGLTIAKATSLEILVKPRLAPNCYVNM